MTILIFVSCGKLLDNIFIAKAIQLGSTNTPENSEFLHAERAQLSLLAIPFMANTLPHQILQSHISALPGEVQKAATEVINTETSMADKRVAKGLVWRSSGVRAACLTAAEV